MSLASIFFRKKDKNFNDRPTPLYEIFVFFYCELPAGRERPEVSPQHLPLQRPGSVQNFENIGHYALTSSFIKYKFLQVKNSLQKEL